MALTGKLGTSDSSLGRVQLGGGGSVAIDVSTGNTLSLTGTATHTGGIFNETPSSSLAISQAVTGFSGTKHVTSPIVFTETVTVGKIYVRTLPQSLIFVQAASEIQIRKASNTFTISQSATALKYKWTNNTIIFAQTLTYSMTPHYERPQQIFTINQLAVGNKVVSRSVSNTFTINQLAVGYRQKTATATSVFVPRGFASSGKILIVSNVLTINQSVTKVKVLSKSLVSNLGLVQSVQRKVIYNFHISQTFQFLNVHSKNDGTGNIIQLPNLIVTKPADIVIYQVPARAVTFRPPVFGDTEGGLGKIIQKKILNGDLYTYVRRNDSRKLVYKFEISEQKKDEFRSFVLSYLSDSIQLTNWKGEIWIGHIINNPFQMKSQGKSSGPCNDESYEIEVQFEGVRIH